MVSCKQEDNTYNKTSTSGVRMASSNEEDMIYNNCAEGTGKNEPKKRLIRITLTDTVGSFDYPEERLRFHAKYQVQILFLWLRENHGNFASESFLKVWRSVT